MEDNVREAWKFKEIGLKEIESEEDRNSKISELKEIETQRD